jgi:periplasmic copper chaperone A
MQQRKSILTGLAATAALAMTAIPASAHVTLETRAAPVGAPYKAVFKVGHGCNGSPTVKLRVRIPEGVIAVKPMPKPGWDVQTQNGKYERAYSFFHGATLTEGVQEVAWSGKLDDKFYDEFVLSMFFSDALPVGQTLYFPVVQECESGVHRWIETPQPGSQAHDLKEPAPGVLLQPRK